MYLHPACKCHLRKRRSTSWQSCVWWRRAGKCAVFLFMMIVKCVMTRRPRLLFVCISTKCHWNPDFQMKNEPSKYAFTTRRALPEARQRGGRALPWFFFFEVHQRLCLKVELTHFINNKMEAAVSYWLNLYEDITHQTGPQINITET